MKTHEYFCNRIHYIEMLNRETRVWESLWKESRKGSYTKSIIDNLRREKVYKIAEKFNELLGMYWMDVEMAISDIINRLVYDKFVRMREISREWATHVLRRYKQINGIVVISVSVQSIERSDSELLIRNLIGDTQIPFAPELTTYKKAYCLITQL